MNKEYLFFLSKAIGAGIKTYERSLNTFGAASRIYKATEKELTASNAFTKRQIEKMCEFKKEHNIFKEYEEMVKKGICFISLEDEEYPERLRKIADAPPFLYLLGRLPDEKLPSISVIGARECTVYGNNVASRLGELLAMEKIPLISGMARGIDSVSQNAATLAGGYSLAVLGGGVDICYPRESVRLYERLLECGGIISEFPPGTAPQPQYFAIRNRIISGLSDAICVVEAKERSGTLITVDCALEQGKEIFAVPGRITDVTSFGTNELIRQGAGIISDLDGFVKDFVASYGGACQLPPPTPSKDFSNLNLSSNELTVLRTMDDNSFTPDQMSEKIGIPSYEILGICVLLASRGLLKNAGAGRFFATREGIRLRNAILLAQSEPEE